MIKCYGLPKNQLGKPKVDTYYDSFKPSQQLTFVLKNKDGFAFAVVVPAYFVLGFLSVPL